MFEEFKLHFSKAKQLDSRSLGRCLTLAERLPLSEFLSLPEILEPKKPAFRVGITGPPGAGKSSLINRLVKGLRTQGNRVAILAVDPSSPFSGGAILGDRIRYVDHFDDEKVFIRSVGSRGNLGGLSAAAYLHLRVLDAVGFDVVVVETVGVGQTELEIVNVADLVGVVLVPESGDIIQGMKAGLTEIADFFIVNKADRPGSEGFKHELQAAFGLAENEKPPKMILTSALNGDGVVEFVDHVCEEKSNFKRSPKELETRLREEARAYLRAQFEVKILHVLSRIHTSKDLSAINENSSLFGNSIAQRGPP